MSIAHYAPGGTNSQHIPLCPWRHKFPTYTIMPLAAQIPNIYHYASGGTKFRQYHLFRVCTGKYSIPDNPFRWASLQKGHPDK
jgi:hypothetical protein